MNTSTIVKTAIIERTPAAITPAIARITAVLALAAICAWPMPALAQAPGFPNVLTALRAAPGCLGVETGQTAGGRQVIFAWFDGKASLVDWYHSAAHQRAMKAVYPNQVFDRTPLPDVAEDSGPILAIVSVKFAEPPAPGARPKMTSIGIELYGPLPGGIAVGGRFAPAALIVRGLREFEPEVAEGRAPRAEPREGHASEVGGQAPGGER